MVARKKSQPAGLALVGKRIDQAAKRARRQSARPKRKSPAQLVREFKLQPAPEATGIPRMLNQSGDEIFEEDVFTPHWQSGTTDAEVRDTICLILGHLNLKVIKTNATKHGTTELELRPYE